MKPEHYQYLRRAVEALGEGQTLPQRVKILRTISEICARDADALELEFGLLVDQAMERNREQLSSQSSS